MLGFSGRISFSHNYNETERMTNATRSTKNPAMFAIFAIVFFFSFVGAQNCEAANSEPSISVIQSQVRSVLSGNESASAAGSSALLDNGERGLIYLHHGMQRRKPEQKIRGIEVMRTSSLQKSRELLAEISLTDNNAEVRKAAALAIRGPRSIEALPVYYKAAVFASDKEVDVLASNISVIGNPRFVDELIRVGSQLVQNKSNILAQSQVVFQQVTMKSRNMSIRGEDGRVHNMPIETPEVSRIEINTTAIIPASSILERVTGLKHGDDYQQWAQWRKSTKDNQVFATVLP